MEARRAPSRALLRYYPLDGAALWFQPSTGPHLPRHVIVDREAYFGEPAAQLEGTAVRVSLSWWHLPVASGPRKVNQPHVDRAALDAGHPRLSPRRSTSTAAGTRAELETEHPAHMLEVAGRAAAELGCEHRAWLGDLDPLAHCLRRLLAEL